MRDLMPELHNAEFAERVKEANSSALGVRNGGAMLSAQVRLFRIVCAATRNNSSMTTRCSHAAFPAAQIDVPM